MKDIFKLQLITTRLVLLTSFCIQKMDKDREIAKLYSNSSYIYSTWWQCTPLARLFTHVVTTYTHTHIPSTLASWTKACGPHLNTCAQQPCGILVFEKQTLRNPFFSNLNLVCISSLNKPPCTGTFTINCLDTTSPSSSCHGFMQVTWRLPLKPSWFKIMH